MMNKQRLRELWRKASNKYRKNHLQECIERSRKFKKKYIEEGRCPSCGVKLVSGENRTCVNCGNTIKGEMKYATNCARLTKII